MLRKDTWENWEKVVLEIFSIALRGLISAKLPPDEKENNLNRKLSVIVRICRRKWCEANRRDIPGHPIYHAKGQAVQGTQTKQPGENKEPEFTWGFTDYINDLDKNYHVECKRLRERKSHYCKEYVVNGIRRFVEKELSYGVGCESGLMIGYIQGMAFEDILRWVNHYAEKHSLPAVERKGQWNENDVSRLENKLFRPQVPISPFKLVHLWADLR